MDCVANNKSYQFEGTIWNVVFYTVEIRQETVWHTAVSDIRLNKKEREMKSKMSLKNSWKRKDYFIVSLKR